MVFRTRILNYWVLGHFGINSRMPWPHEAVLRIMSDVMHATQELGMKTDRVRCWPGSYHLQKYRGPLTRRFYVQVDFS